MKKEINEKTFELNITYELLNLSKSFFWYLNHSHWVAFPNIRNRNLFKQFLNQATLFAEGLTQKQENDPLTGGYDVSINFSHPNGQEGRLMFLQYKAGVTKSYSNNSASNFHRQKARLNKITPKHILFTFNDAAHGTQHSTLRNLANRKGIQPLSVMYVFPRITEKTDFRDKIGSLILSSSFVPVLDLDTQAFNQTPPIIISDGDTHKYRTSYNGLTSEVNYFFFLYTYNNIIVSGLLSELICIQIERLVKILLNQDEPFLEIFFDVLSEGIIQFVESELKLYPSKDIIIKNIYSYIQRIKVDYRSNEKVPEAPSHFTTVIPKEGLMLNFDDNNDFSSLYYQIF